MPKEKYIPKLQPGMIVSPRLSSSMSFEAGWRLVKFISVTDDDEEMWQCICTAADADDDYITGDTSEWYLDIKKVLRANAKVFIKPMPPLASTETLSQVEEEHYKELIDG